MSSPAQSNIQVTTGTGPEVAAYPVTWNNQASNIQAMAQVDPSSGLSPSVNAAGTPGTLAITVQGIGTSGTVQVSGNLGITSLPSLAAGGNAIGSVTVTSGLVSISGTPSVNATVSNFPASYGPGFNQAGTTGQFAALADASAVISAATSGVTQLIAGVSGKQIYITGFDWIANSTGGTAQFVEGGSNTPVTGAYPLTAETGLSRGGGIGAIWTLPVGAQLSVNLQGGGAIYGSISYTVK